MLGGRWSVVEVVLGLIDFSIFATYFPTSPNTVFSTVTSSTRSSSTASPELCFRVLWVHCDLPCAFASLGYFVFAQNRILYTYHLDTILRGFRKLRPCPHDAVESRMFILSGRSEFACHCFTPLSLCCLVVGKPKANDTFGGHPV